MPADMRQPALVFAIVLTLAACGNGPSAGVHATPSPIASASPVASASPTSAPSPTPPPVVATASAVAVLDWDQAGATYTVSLVGTDGKVLASAHASAPRSFTCAGQPAGAILPVPVAASNSKLYYLDGTGLYSLGLDGSQKKITDLPVKPQVAVPFAVAPDDTWVAYGVIDYTAYPPTEQLFVKGLQTGETIRSYIATSKASEAVWPVGWHAGVVVLAFHPQTCTQGGGPGLADATEYHLVDSRTAARSATVGSGSCTEVVAAGALCVDYGAGAVKLFGWTGTLLTSIAGGTFPVASVSPDGSRFAVGLSDGIHISGPDTTPAPVAGGPETRWIDNVTLFIGGLGAQDQPKIWKVGGAVIPVGVRGSPVAQVPGGLDAGHGT
jgi:hypothetical protein